MWTKKQVASDHSLLQVDETVLARTFADLQGCLPCEGVGLWSGSLGRVMSWHPLQNVAAKPQVRYAVHPQEWLDALRQIHLADQVPIALVHSHPTAEAFPSAYDREHWHHPDMCCVIVSFASGKPIWRAHQMQNSYEKHTRS